jgi:hypothetical protein
MPDVILCRYQVRGIRNGGWHEHRGVTHSVDSLKSIPAACILSSVLFRCSKFIARSMHTTSPLFLRHFLQVSGYDPPTRDMSRPRQLSASWLVDSVPTNWSTKWKGLRGDVRGPGHHPVSRVPDSLPYDSWRLVYHDEDWAKQAWHPLQIIDGMDNLFHISSPHGPWPLPHRRRLLFHLHLLLINASAYIQS